MGQQNGPTTLYSLAETANGTLVNGSAYSITSSPQAILANVQIFAAQVTTTTPGSATSAPPNRFVLQGNQYASDDTKWVDLYSFSTGLSASANTTVSGAISAGATSFTTAGSNTFGGRTFWLYLRDSSTSGEWVTAQGQSSTTITVPSPGVVNSHSSGIGLYNQAFRFMASGFDVSSLQRLRIQVDNNQQSSGPTLAVFATVETFG